MTVFDTAFQDEPDHLTLEESEIAVQTEPMHVAPARARSSRTELTAASNHETAVFVGSSRYGRALRMIAPLMISDGAALVIATCIAFGVLRLFGPLPICGIHIIMPGLAIATLVAYLACDQYAIVGINPVVEFRQLTKVNTLVFVAITIGTYLVSADVYWRLFFAIEWAAALFFTPIFRSLVRAWCARQKWWGQPVLLFGTLEAVTSVADTLNRRPSSGLRPVGMVLLDEDFAADRFGIINEFSVQGDIKPFTITSARSLIRRQAIAYGIVATPDPQRRAALVDAATALSLPSVLLINPEQVLPTLWCDARDCAGLQATEVRNRLLQSFPRFVKRTVDLTLTIAGGILILPVFAGIALAIKLTCRGPIFFGQTRIGQKGRNFTAWKFRTMRADAADVLEHYLEAHPELRAEWERDHKLKNDPRVTTIGRVLRKTSLDELPQLWNVIRGEMSLVGPRPIVEAEIDKYGEIYRQYLLVRPGITGMWQVSGRNNTSYQERIELDRYYVQNWSPWLDFHLLIRTARIVFNRSGAY